MADTMDTQNAEEAAEIKKKRTFRKFSYRGVDLDAYVFRLFSIPSSTTTETNLDGRTRSWDNGDGTQ